MLLLLALVGSKVTVTLKSNVRYTGIFHTAAPPTGDSSSSPSSMLGVCLKMARKHTTTSTTSSTAPALGPVIPTLLILGKDVADIQASNVQLPFFNHQQSVSSMTAADLAARQQTASGGGKTNDIVVHQSFLTLLATFSSKNSKLIQPLAVTWTCVNAIYRNGMMIPPLLPLPRSSTTTLLLDIQIMSAILSNLRLQHHPPCHSTRLLEDIMLVRGISLLQMKSWVLLLLIVKLMSLF